jgi:pimeloyl-ACP methyl ester carboxylesterase
MSRETLVLLHGLGRSAWSMRAIEQALSNDYHIINKTYPSRKHSIEQLAEIAIGSLRGELADSEKVHFVTHSLGGILERQYLYQHHLPNIGRTVMLGPPNQGSELAEFLLDYKLFEWVNGPAGQQLGTTENSLPISLGNVSYAVGIIAGNRSFNPLFSRFFTGEDDGKVSVERSKVNGMTDHLVLPTTHTFMMRNPKVIEQIRHFLIYGKFSHDQT